MAIKPIEILIKAKDEASGIFGSLQSKVVGVGVAIAGYFGISAFIGAIKGASELEAKLSEVKAVSGATAAEMVLLRKAAEDAGATTKFTATEAAEALGNLSRAGLSAKDSIAALPAVLTLAQAGGIGLGEASEYVTKAVMGMGLAFTDAGRVADVLAMGANASNTSVTGLAQALSYAAPVAKSLGLSLETTVAIIGKFADAGIDASRAGTALNAILSQFADPASKFRQELAAAGITTNNFETALRQLEAAGPAGQKAILAVGTEAGPALRALLNQGIGALDDLKAKLDNAAGSAAATAKVMEDNLQGSFRGLSSAWDTVKNTLTTPVLPVLKNAVEQLSDAFRNAVNDGTIAKFGETIATAFQAGIKWAREFLSTVDFAALIARMQAFAAQAQDTFTQIGEYASNAGNIVKTVYGVMSAGTNAVLTSIYGIGVAFAETASFILKTGIKINEGLQKIAFGDAKTRLINETQEMRTALIGVDGVSTELSRHMKTAMEGVVDSAQLAREGMSGLVGSTTDAERQAKTSTQAFQTLGETLKEVGGDATASGQKAQAAGILHKEAAEQARTAVAELKKEYEAAVSTGNWQLAAEKIQTLKKAADDAKSGITDLRKKAEEEAALTATAFTNAGIKTKTELKNLADNAEADFKRIKASGQATTEGLQTAFKNYAEKAIAASGAVGSEQRAVTEEILKAKGAVEGLSVTFDVSGKMIVQTQAEAIAAIDKANAALGKQKEGLESVVSALERQNAAQERTNAATERAIDLENKRLNRDKEGFSTDKSGNRIAAGGDLTTLTGIASFLKSAGVADEAKARSIAKEFADSQGNVTYLENAGQKKYGGDTISVALLRAAERYTFGIGGNNNGPSGSTTIPEQSKSATYVSNITIPGVGSSTLNFADANSQRAGEDLLRKLAQAKGASI